MQGLFQPGDRFRLHGAGPVLIAKDVYSDVNVTCTWMDEMGQRHEGSFRRDTLEKLEPFDFGDHVLSGETGEPSPRPAGLSLKRPHLHTFAMTAFAALGLYLVG